MPSFLYVIIQFIHEPLVEAYGRVFGRIFGIARRKPSYLSGLDPTLVS